MYLYAYLSRNEHVYVQVYLDICRDKYAYKYLYIFLVDTLDSPVGGKVFWHGFCPYDYIKYEILVFTHIYVHSNILTLKYVHCLHMCVAHCIFP